MEQSRFSQLIDWLARAFNAAAAELEAAFAAGGQLMAPHTRITPDRTHDE